MTPPYTSPQLTARGIEQATTLDRNFPFKHEVGLVFASPLRQTIQTAVLGLWDAVDTRYYTDGIGGTRDAATFLLQVDI
jgi:hypothetical protein